MKKFLRKNSFVLFGSVAILVIGFAFFALQPNSLPAKSLDSFAACIADSGARFYGAFWCSHCQAQKKLFQNSAELPYVECSTADARGQLPVCTSAGVKAYPTWRFDNGAEKTGELSFDELALQTGCPAP